MKREPLRGPPSQAGASQRALDNDAEAQELLALAAQYFNRRGRPRATDTNLRAAVVRALVDRHKFKVEVALNAVVDLSRSAEDQCLERWRIERAYQKQRASGRFTFADDRHPLIVAALSKLK